MVDEAARPLTLDEWVENKEIPSNVGDCEGHVEHELIDGSWRIYAGHKCNKEMVLKIKMDQNTYETNAV